MSGPGVPGESSRLGRRLSPRLRLIAKARLITRSGIASVTIDNISETGAHLTRPGAEPFTLCVLEWLGHELLGEMVWAQPGHCGIRFDSSLTADVILKIKQRFPEIAESSKLPVPDHTRTV